MVGSPNQFGIPENSTELSTTFSIPGEGGKTRFINAPTIFGGRLLSPREAIPLAIQRMEAGDREGIFEFDTMEKALTAAQKRSDDLGKLGMRLNALPPELGLGNNPELFRSPVGRLPESELINQLLQAIRR
ncbi:hypothetical protein LCGC14_0928170 [marine sediment metagenome]|uniref:Uncharacterized protein n=1 Tax=marine sediment metagenome TaxID=412755 RepID=A0A0F9R784_9ZZZZ